MAASRALSLGIALTLAGCGAKMVAIQPGTLTCQRETCKGMQLTLDAEKHEATFTFEGKTVKRTTSAWPQERWPNLCPQGTRAIKTEVFDLGPDPLVLGKITIEKPLLVADCLGGTRLDVKPADAAGEPRGPDVLVFER